MSNNFKEYEGALRYNFALSFGGKPSDWSTEVQPVKKDQPALAEFKNEALGITLKVQDMGYDAEGNAKFVGEAVNIDYKFSTAMPPNCKNLVV